MSQIYRFVLINFIFQKINQRLIMEADNVECVEIMYG